MNQLTIKESLIEVLNSNTMKDSMTKKQINILCSAIELFSEKGYEATTTSEIAKKAQVAEGTIFRYYKTKKDLLFAIPACLSMNSIHQILLEEVITIFDDKSKTLEDFLRTLILNRQKFATENMAILKIIFQEIPFHPELRYKISSTLFLPTINRFTQVIDRFKEQGQIVDKPSSTIVNLIITTVFGYFFTRYIAMLDFNWDNENDVENLIQYIMNGISTTKTRAN